MRIPRFAAAALVAMISFCWFGIAFAQEDKAAQAAIEIFKTQMRIPADVEVKFIEKKESDLPGFSAVKLLLIGYPSAPDKELPVVIYVDETGERVIVGTLFIKGENATRKAAGEAQPRKIDMARLEIEKSSARGPANAKVTILEFANFTCPYCLKSWMKIKEWLDKHPQDVRYVFKQFPLASQAGSFDFSVLVAAAQDINDDAFWAAHDFFYSPEGQNLIKGNKETVRPRLEEFLKAKKLDLGAFQAAIDSGKAKKSVDESVSLGTRIHVGGTPTTIINGEFVRGPLTDEILDRFLKK
jgi:protein-disulfide isomerase